LPLLRPQRPPPQPLAICAISEFRRGVDVPYLHLPLGCRVEGIHALNA
jgi:hypothetical protein